MGSPPNTVDKLAEIVVFKCSSTIVPIARDAGVAEAGIELHPTEDISLGVSYAGQFANRSTDQTANAMLGLRFSSFSSFRGLAVPCQPTSSSQGWAGSNETIPLAPCPVEAFRTQPLHLFVAKPRRFRRGLMRSGSGSGSGSALSWSALPVTAALAAVRT